MDLQTLLANGIGIVGGFASLGGTFDKILTTDQTRAKIGEFLKRSRLSSQRKIFDYIALVNETVFRRYFSAPFFSFRYFCTCAVVSIASLVVILLVQLIAHGRANLDGVTFDAPQVAILLGCLAFNVIIDWISIGQTQVFFEISERQTKFSNAAVLIVSDFVLTINVFSLLYAQPLGLGLYLYGLIPQQASIVATVNAEEIKPGDDDQDEETSEETSAAFAKSKPLFKIAFAIDLKSPSDGRNKYGGDVRVTATTPDISLSDVLRLSSDIVSNSVVSSERYFIVPQKDQPDERRKASARATKEWKHLIEDLGATEKEELTVKLSAFGEPRSRMLAYSAVYRQVDEVQDGFPAVMFLPANFLSVQSMKTTYYALIAENQHHISACGNNIDGQVRWERKLGAVSCENEASFSPRSLISLRSRMQGLNSNISNKVVPLNSFFMTSLSVTALLYFAAFFLFLARELYQRVLIGMSPIEHIFLRSPLAVVGLLVGMCAFGVTLIV